MPGPGARFSKAPGGFRARKAICRSSVSKNIAMALRAQKVSGAFEKRAPSPVYIFSTFVMVPRPLAPAMRSRTCADGIQPCVCNGGLRGISAVQVLVVVAGLSR